MKRTRLFIIFILLCCSHALWAQVKRGPRQTVDMNAVADSSIYAGTLYIKFKPGFETYLKKDIGKTNTGTLTFGIGKLDRVLAQLQASKAKRSFEPALSGAKDQFKHQSWDLQRWYTIGIPTHKSVQAAVRQLRALTDIIEVAEPSYIRRLFDDTDPVQMWTPADSAYAQQWHFNHTTQQGPTDPPGTDADIDLPEAWELETGKPNVIVAVFDGGVDTSHPDLRPNLWIGNNGEHFGYNWNTYTSQIQPNSHGTHVTGTIGAVTNNNIGIAGIAGGNGTANSGVRIMSMQVFGSGGMYAGDEAVANAYVFAADRGASIAQNSWGGGSFSTMLTDAFDYFIMNGGGNSLSGGILFFSAGNDGNETQNFPGTYAPVVCVASTNYNDKKSYYSVYGDWVDIAAPGGELYAYSGGPLQFGGKKAILSTLPVSNGSYGWMQGTSMACPHVSGVAALCISKAPGIMSSEQLRNILLTNTDNIYSLNPSYTGKLGSGRVNAYKAVQAAALQTAAIVDSATHFTASQNCSDVLLSWNKNASNNNVLIAVSDSLVFGLPSGAYNVNDVITGGGKVIYKGNATSMQTSIPVNQRKYFRIWSYAGTDYSLSRTTSAIYQKQIGLPAVTAAMGCAMDVVWDDNLGCVTDSVLLLEHNRQNFGTPAGMMQVGDTVDGGAKVIFKGRANSYSYNTTLDSNVYIQKWNFNASGQYSNADEFYYATASTSNAIKSLTAVAASSSSIHLQWDDNPDNCFGGSTYMLVYNTSSNFGNPQGTYTVGNNIPAGGTVIYIGTNKQFQHNGLVENSNYCYQLFKIRNGQEYSFGKTVCTKTACSISKISLPYQYGFNGEDLSDPDICFWRVENNTDLSSALKIVSSGTHPDLLPLEGDGMLRFNAYNVSTDETARLISKPIVKAPGVDMDIRFRWYQDSSNYTSSTYYGEGVMVQWADKTGIWQNLEFYPRVPEQGLTGWSYKQISLPPAAKAKDSIYLSFLFVSKFGNNMFLDDLKLQQSSYKPSDGTLKAAVCESTDSSTQWTNYYDSSGNRLLSIKKYANNIGKAGQAQFQLMLNGNSNASLVPSSGSNYVSNPGGWLCMNRYYEIHPTAEPTDTVKIRFYFTDNDLAGISNAGNMLQPARNNISATDLFAYKINDPANNYNPNPVATHVNIPLANNYAATGFRQYFNATKADTASWQYSAMGNGIHAMDYTVKRLADGGGLGIGSTSGYGALPLLVYTFIGNGDWNISSNWLNNAIPPAIIPSNAQVIINPTGNGECVLNIEQRVMPGASITVMPGKNFRITTSLEIKQ